MIQNCTEKERKSLDIQVCPDCGTYKKFLAGPHGGLCQNIRCGVCGSEFNVGPRVHGELLSAQRISEKSPKLAVRDAPAGSALKGETCGQD